MFSCYACPSNTSPRAVTYIHQKTRNFFKFIWSCFWNLTYALNLDKQMQWILTSVFCLPIWILFDVLWRHFWSFMHLELVSSFVGYGFGIVGNEYLTLFYIEMQRCYSIGEWEIDVLRRSSLASIFSPTLLSSWMLFI